MARPPKTSNNKHYFMYPDLPRDEQQARSAQEKAVSEAPAQPSVEQLRHGGTVHRLSLITDARMLGKELSEVWELED